MNIDTDRLQRKVDTRNKVNAKANELQAEFAKLLQPFVGKKVIKVTPYRQWTKQVAAVIDPLISREGLDTEFRIVFNYSAYSVYATVDTTYRLSEYSVDYVKQEFTVCRLDGNCDGTSITGLPDLANFRTDYTLEEVVQKMTELSELEAKVADIKSQLREFTK
jgi:hypothetical protein